jgi:hypothetical protein
VYQLQRLLGNPEIVVDVLVTMAIVAAGLWIVLALLSLPEKLSKKACPSCLRITRGAKKCQHCGSAF